MAAGSFGVWLAGQLQRAEMKQVDLHRRSGLSTGAISEWLRGIRIPDPENCDRIADALGIPVDVVLSAAGHRPKIQMRETPEIEESLSMMRSLPREEQQVVLEYVRFRWELTRKRGN